MKYINGGAVASESKEAAEAAIHILNQGGNAVDAAIAATAVQGITRPYSCGIGGGGVFHLYLAKEQRFIIIDHRVSSPAQFDEKTLNNEDIPANALISSGLATAVPGAVKAWEEALEQYGTMTLEEVLQPAIHVGEEGFVVDQNFMDETAENKARFNLFTSTKKLYLDEKGEPLKAGKTIKNKDFAKTYRLIAKHGSQVFYEGEIAKAIVEAVQNPPVVDQPDFKAVDSNWDGAYGVLKGTMTLEDLKNYQTITTKPLKTTYQGYDIYSPPPVSSGGITIGEALNILEGYDLKHLPRSKALHYFIEACRLAFADRNAYIGDPKYTQVPVSGLLSKEFAHTRRKQILEDQALQSKANAGDPWPFNGKKRKASQTSSKEKSYGDSTIHLSVSDAEGNIVSYTSTIISFGGNGIVVPGYGFLLNNALVGMLQGDEDATPNRPQPNKRPLSSMAPTIVMKDGKPKFTLGSPGSETILTTLIQTIINYIDFEMPFPEAVAAPRLSQTNEEHTKTKYERIFKDQYDRVLEDLQQMGHQFIEEKAPQGIGSVTALQFIEDRYVRAVAEPHRRGSGHALVQDPQKDQKNAHIAE